MSEVTESLKEAIINAITEDELNLPTLPEVALNVREEASNPNSTVNTLCKILEKDAAIAARIIKVANSPMFRSAQSINNLKTATSRLGVRYTSNLATAVAMRQMFQATNAKIDKLFRESWEESTLIATQATAYAQLKPWLHPDHACLAGLTHKIGVLPILVYAENNPKAVGNLDNLQTLIDELHQELGTKILQAWDFPEDLIIVPQEYLNFERECEQADYVDVVTASLLQGAESSTHPYSYVELEKVTAFKRLGVHISESQDVDNAENVEHIELSALFSA